MNYPGRAIPHAVCLTSSRLWLCGLSAALLLSPARADVYDIGTTGAIGTGTNWNAAANPWTPNTAAPGETDDIAITDVTGEKQINVNATYSINSLSYDETDNVVFVGPGTLNVGTLTKSGAGTLVLASKYSGGALVLNAASITVNEGLLSLGADTGATPTNSLFKALNGLTVTGSTSVAENASLHIYSTFSGGSGGTKALGATTLNGALGLSYNSTGVRAAGSTYTMAGLSGAGTGAITGATTEGAASSAYNITLRFVQAAGTNATYNGSINQGGINTISIEHNGGGFQALNGATAYTGTTKVTAGGVLVFGGDSTIGGGGTQQISLSGGSLVNGGSILGLGYGDLTTWGVGTGAGNISMFGATGFAAYGADRTVTFTNGDLTWAANGFVSGSPGILVLGHATSTHTLTFANNIALAGTGSDTTRTLLVHDGAAAIDGRLSGLISGGLIGITKRGAGTLALTNANTYVNTTLVAEGTLLLNNTSGSATGSSVINIAAGATLGGSGGATGLVTTADGTSVIAPGGVTPGTLALSGGLDATAGATFNFALGSASSLLDLTGATFTGSSAAGGLLFNFFNSGGLTAGVTYTLLNFSLSENLDYTDLLAGSTPAGFTLDAAFGDNGWLINGGSLQVQFIASPVPEASTAALLIGGTVGLLAGLRRRRHP